MSELDVKRIAQLSKELSEMTKLRNEALDEIDRLRKADRTLREQVRQLEQAVELMREVHTGKCAQCDDVCRHAYPVSASEV